MKGSEFVLCLHSSVVVVLAHKDVALLSRMATVCIAEAEARDEGGAVVAGSLSDEMRRTDGRRRRAAAPRTNTDGQRREGGRRSLRRGGEKHLPQVSPHESEGGEGKSLWRGKRRGGRGREGGNSTNCHLRKTSGMKMAAAERSTLHDRERSRGLQGDTAVCESAAEPTRRNPCFK